MGKDTGSVAFALNLDVKDTVIWEQAPTARNMIARGKHERSECVAPGPYQKAREGLKGRNNRRRITPFSGLNEILASLTRGDALASLALAPGYHIPRLRR